MLVDAFTAVGGSQYVDSPGIGNYHTYLCDELVPFVDAQFPTLPDAAHRGIQGKSSGGYGAMVTPLLRPDLFGGLATHAGDALFEVCYARDFAPAARALRDAYDGSFDAFWEDFRSGRPVLSSPYDELLVNTYAMCAAYSSSDDGTVDLPFDLETGELVPRGLAALAALRSRSLLAREPQHAETLRGMRGDLDRLRAATTSTTSSSARPRSTARSSPPACPTSASTSSSSRARHRGLTWRYPLSLAWLVERLSTHLVARLPEAELAVERMRVRRVQQPLDVGVRPVVDHLAHELLAEAAAAVLGTHVDVGEVRDREPVREARQKPICVAVVVEADDA